MTRDAVSLTVRRGGGSAVIEVTGTLDATTAPVLMEPVRMLLARGVRRLRIDLDGIELIDSRGLTALIVCRRRAHHSGAELGTPYSASRAHCRASLAASSSRLRRGTVPMRCSA